MTYECGNTLMTKLGGLVGMVTCISNRFGKITYEFSYFKENQEYVSIWLSEAELMPYEPKPQIGYKQRSFDGKPD